MKICYMSDIHIEFHGVTTLRTLTVPECDVLVVAGDLFPIEEPQFEKVLNILKDKAPQVIYVAGNHEFYDNIGRWSVTKEGQLLPVEAPSFSEKVDYFNSLSKGNLHCAADYKQIKIAGQTFHLGTLWFPFAPDTFEMYVGPRRAAKWADFEWIVGVTPDDIYKVNEDFHKKILGMEAGDVVVTHHLPSWMCVNPKYHGTEGNRFFVGGEFQDLIVAAKPSLWIHGHTHEPVDLTLDDTRIVCNPYGYPNQVRLGWKPEVITVKRKENEICVKK
jgi:predicted phosphodiesterase